MYPYCNQNCFIVGLYCNLHKFNIDTSRPYIYFGLGISFVANIGISVGIDNKIGSIGFASTLSFMQQSFL